MAKTAVIGAGSWGTALSLVLHTNGNDVTVWSIVEQEVQMLREKHEHALPILNVISSGSEITGRYYIYHRFKRGDRGKRLSDPCGAVCFYEKHGKIYGTFCKKGTGNRLCGKRY